jgi:hypothetical protein
VGIAGIPEQSRGPLPWPCQYLIAARFVINFKLERARKARKMIDPREQYAARKAADDCRRRERGAPKERGPIFFFHPDPLVKFNGYLAIFTLLLVVVTAISVAVLWKTDATLHETLVAANRAWISPQTVRLTSDIEIWTPATSIQVIYENVGRFPALNLNHAEEGGARAIPEGFAEWEQLDFGENHTCKSLTPLRGGPTVYPSQHFGGELTYELKPDQSRNPANVIQEILKGRRLIWVQGCFAYLSFEKPRESAFCFYLQPDVVRHIREWPFKKCSTGNHAT